jgi:hypothetical protein
MWTNVCLWKYLAEMCLEWETFQTNAVEKVKTDYMPDNIYPKIVSFMR